MVQIPSWKANWSAASQKIPRISRNPKVHYHTHKRPPPVSILGQPNPVHIPTSHLLKIHPNIIHTYKPTSTQWSLSLRFPQQDHIHPPFLTHTRHMSSPSLVSLSTDFIVLLVRAKPDDIRAVSFQTVIGSVYSEIHEGRWKMCVRLCVCLCVCVFWNNDWISIKMDAPNNK